MTRVQSFLDEQVAAGRTPGAAALVLTKRGRRTSAVSGAIHGGAQGGGAVPPIRPDTPFDLASLTKLLCTTVAIARAIDERRLALDETPFACWPTATVADVMAHRAGLPAWRPLYTLAEERGPVALPPARSFIVGETLATPPEAAPGARTLYSDLGFIALGALLEERYGRPLDEIFAMAGAATFGPTGLRFVRIDMDGFHEAVPHVAATERCAWRKRLLHGQVHDENCYAMGGVSGHAGLFGSLDDCERAGNALLDAVLGDTTLGRFAGARGPRGLGFDRATPGGATGDALGPRTVGHLGFTGTSMWMDPDLDGGALFILLTNHVHQGRDAARIRAVRQGFHRAAVGFLVDDRA